MRTISGVLVVQLVHVGTICNWILFEAWMLLPIWAMKDHHLGMTSVMPKGTGQSIWTTCVIRILAINPLQPVELTVLTSLTHMHSVNYILKILIGLLSINTVTCLNLLYVNWIIQKFCLWVSLRNDYLMPQFTNLEVTSWCVSAAQTFSKIYLSFSDCQALK